MDQISGAVPVTSFYPGRQIQQGRTSQMQRDPAGNYTVHGSNRGDRITVSEYSPPMMLQHEPSRTTKYLRVQVNNDIYLVPLDGRNAAKSVGIDAGAGNDSVTVDPNVTTPLFINGGAGNDFIKGGSGPNALLGGGGNDTLVGGPSDDLLLDGSGFNTVIGGGGRDMYSLSDLFNRLREGRCCSPQIPVSIPEQPSPQPTPTAPPVVVAPPPPPPTSQIIQTPQLRPPAPPLPPKKPQTPPRPPLSNLMAEVDTYNENGFKSGRAMTKNLLTALYESPAKFHQTLASISGAKEKDDAVASFARALLDAGPQGGRLLRSISTSDQKTMAQYLSIGNSWSANKKGIMLLLSKMTGVTGPGTTGLDNDPSANEFYRRYQGVL